MNREEIIQRYIDAYNNLDVEGMIANFTPTIKFENISDGMVNMSIDGLTAFEEQAKQARAYFSERKQTITSYAHENDQTTIEIDYAAVLAIDFPNVLKKGDKLNLKGRSIFKFSDNKISALTDIS